jgi:hypothetical protein
MKMSILGSVLFAGLMATMGSGCSNNAKAASPLNIDVSCNGKTYFATGPGTTDNPPIAKAGATFILQGYMYPGGTLMGGGNGVLADGTSDAPTKVLGKWYCRGWFVNGGYAQTPNGSTPWVVTTQVFDFGNKKTLVTDGIELPDVNVGFTRAVVGGSSDYNSAMGDVTQTALGVNATGVQNFTMQFNLL